jgi:hypothetical protein
VTFQPDVTTQRIQSRLAKTAPCGRSRLQRDVSRLVAGANLQVFCRAEACLELFPATGRIVHGESSPLDAMEEEGKNRGHHLLALRVAGRKVHEADLLAGAVFRSAAKNLICC